MITKAAKQERLITMISSYKLFTTEICPNCHSVKEFIKELDLKGEDINASEEDGLKKAQEAGVSSVPTAILLDEEGNEVSRAHSVDQIKQALEENSQ